MQGRSQEFLTGRGIKTGKKNGGGRGFAHNVTFPLMHMLLSLSCTCMQGCSQGGLNNLNTPLPCLKLTLKV
jgi:hypothetical protein